MGGVPVVAERISKQGFPPGFKTCEGGYIMASIIPAS
jgi:hypothetical protein